MNDISICRVTSEATALCAMRGAPPRAVVSDASGATDVISTPRLSANENTGLSPPYPPLCLAIVAPGEVIAWYGLGATLLLEALAALVICKLVKCRIPIAYWPLLPLWSLLRVSAWLACWLPWPVTWRGQKLWSPRLYDPEASG